jgi:2-polyprenyl-3-methyl-5-hydroxy-6-metoxy-1,4-benzoquinol methylase
MSDNLNLASVVDAWRQADVEAIHPLRAVDVDAYWESGRYQALDASRWIPEGGTVMDFGCGDGRLTLPLARLGFDVYAVDSSPEMLARVEANLRALDEPAVTILSDGTTDLAKLIGTPLDAIVCRAVLIHHDYEDGTRLVLALSKLLKPGGHLIADWPTGPRYERQHWTDVTTWEPAHRLAVADGAGLVLVDDSTPSVWMKR